jgi:hypothetical protein
MTDQSRNRDRHRDRHRNRNRRTDDLQNRRMTLMTMMTLMTTVMTLYAPTCGTGASRIVCGGRADCIDRCELRGVVISEDRVDEQLDERLPLRPRNDVAHKDLVS